MTVALLGSALCADMARAQVFEIDAQGQVLRRDDSQVVAWSPVLQQIDEDENGTGPNDLAFPSAAVTSLDGPSPPPPYRQAVVAAAETARISPLLLEAIVWQESRWRADAVSPAGAIGLGQLMPATARELGVDPRDPEQNLLGTAHYLRQQLDRFDNDIEQALAAYNAGPGRVQRAGGVPDIRETREYVSAITARMAALTLIEEQ